MNLFTVVYYLDIWDGFIGVYYKFKEDKKMDIKESIEKIVDKVKNDDSFKSDFKKDPVKAIEKVAGIDISDGMVDKVVAGVQAKIGADKAEDALGALKKLF